MLFANEPFVLGPGISILLVILLMLASGGIIFLLMRGTRKERARRMELTDEKENLNFDGMKRFIARVIQNAGKRTTFYLCRIDFNDFDALKKSIGDTQYTNIMRSISAAINKTMPYPVRVCSLESGGLLIYIKPYMAFDPAKTCEVMLSTVSKEYTLTNDLTVEINCNVALLSYPEAGGNVDELLKNMDMCMIVSKRSGLDKYIIYSAQISNAETQEYQMYSEIKEAMKTNEFGIHYQPVVNAENMEVVMGEGLIRWKHKTMGLLPPNKFLYIMEKTGDINWVGYWCFERIARQGQTWQANYEQKFELSTNISERQLLNSAFADEIKRLERKIRMSPGTFIFEISNLNLYFSSDVARYNVDMLKDMGFKIAYDGYDANMNTRLEELPLDYIKLNASFWRKAAESSIYLNLLKMLVDYSNNSKVKLIAYGVENIEDIEKLKEMGITYMQGYAFSKPTESSEFISEVLLTPWATDIATGNVYTVKTEQPVDIDVMEAMQKLADEKKAAESRKEDAAEAAVPEAVVTAQAAPAEPETADGKEDAPAAEAADTADAEKSVKKQKKES
ncbi:MAG: EAL domain-containing protein [Clostridiales bacterium]|jgi:EAL domain-containing protein (putative c-di-GMP-specific phosphodiesterase class I)/GGDEF domain-containing protein|nr:EAL domain-containing protein [Clostridiales bacterium]